MTTLPRPMFQERYVGPYEIGATRWNRKHASWEYSASVDGTEFHWVWESELITETEGQQS